MMAFPSIEIRLPDWIADAVPDPQRTYPTIADRMALVIDLARRNVDAQTGGPFGAGIFEAQTGRLVAPGVNRVIPGNCSIAHAEVTAIMLAQKMRGTYDLGAAGVPPMELVSSTEPCAMCLGAVVWSGVRQLVCGARGEDAQSIGFDEGPKASNWVAALEDRGITVIRDVARKEAAAVLERYVNKGGLIYNTRQTG